MATPQVTVMGAGVFGLSVALACAERGARVTLRDPAGIGAGASGGVLGALAPHTPENWTPAKAFQFESLSIAGAFWGRVAALSGRDPGYARLGRLQPVPDGAALARATARVSSASTHWQGRAVWRVIPAEAAGAWAPESASGWLIHDTLTARLHPARATAALAGAVAALGGAVETGAAPARGPVVWATGHRGLADLSADLGQEVGRGVKGQALRLSLETPRASPQIFADGLHIVPHDDATVAVGSTTERDFDDPAATDTALDAVHARAVAACPALAGAPVRDRWAGIRPRARSRQPILGAWPGRPGAFVANGGFKTGFGMAPKVGQVMAALVLDGEDTIPEGMRVADNLRGDTAS